MPHPDSPSSARGSNRLLLRGAFVLVALSVTAGLCAMLATARLANSQVAIGLDTDTRFTTLPEVRWGEGDDMRAPFEAVPSRFSVVQPYLELLPVQDRNPESSGNKVWLAQHPRIEPALDTPLEKRFHPFDLGQRYLWYQINTGNPADRYLWRRNEDTPVPVFLKTPDSGKVKFRTPDGESIVDLYSPDVVVTEISEEHLTAARYFATVPRRALSDLQIVIPGEGGAKIHRLYVGTSWPRIYFPGEAAYPNFSVTPLLGTVVTQWDPVWVEGAISIQTPAWEQGGAATLALLFSLAWGALALLALCGWLVIWLLKRAFRGARTPVPALAPPNPGRFLVFFAAFCAVYGFYLGCAYPGIMSPDSIAQWEQAHTWDLSDDHPALHTLSYKPLIALWDNTAVVAVVQILCMSLTLAYAFSLLLRAGTPNWLVVLLFHLALLSPKNGILSVTLWKDVPFAILVLLVSVLLFRLCFLRKRWMEAFYWTGLGLGLGLLPLVRHNGLLILLGVAPLLPLVFWRWKGRAFLLGTVLSLVLFASVKYGLYPKLNVEKWEGLSGYLYTVKSAILIDQDVPLSADEYRFLDTVRDIGPDRWAFNSHTGNTTVNDSYDWEFAIANEEQYTAHFRDITKRYPLLFVQDHLERSHYVWAPAHPEGRTKHREHYLSRPENPWHIQQAGYPTKPFFPEFGRVLGELITVLQAGGCVLMRPAVALYAVLVTLLVLAARMRLPRVTVAYLPALLSTLSVLVIPIASQIRYQFPLTLAAGFLIGLAFIKRPRSAEPEEALAAAPPPQREDQAVSHNAANEADPNSKTVS